MASFVAPGVLSLGAGAALYNFGYQGQYKEDVAVASSAALTVFAVLSVVQRLIGGSSTAAVSSGETKKKKKNKTKKAAAESDDSDSLNTEKAPKLKGDADSAKGNKAEAKKADKTKKPEKAEKEQASKGKGKEEKKEASQQLDKKGDKQNAKTKVTEAKSEQKANSKSSNNDAKKGAESTKDAKKGDAKKGQPAKANESAKKSKKQEESEESEEDDRGFLRLGQKNTGSLSTPRAPVVQQEESDEEDSDDDEAPAKAALSTSKSAIRRRKQKENKEKAAATAESSAKPSNKPVVDKDGFETVATTRRPKKPAATTSTATGSSDSKTETKATPANFSDTIELESRQIALLIGPKGETMNALREACGGNIRIDTPARDSADKKVTVSGEEASVKYCLKQIRELMTKGYCSALSPGTSSSTMAVPGIAQAILVGPKGVNIQKIQEKLGVVIKTPAKNSGSEQITISGPKDSIKKAKEVIHQIIEHGFSSITHEGYEVGEVAFPRSELRHLIGPGGHTIKSIQGDTKTKVKIPDEFAENQNIQVVGPAEGVAKAIKQISTLLERKAAKEAAAADAAALNSEDED